MLERREVASVEDVEGEVDFEGGVVREEASEGGDRERVRAGKGEPLIGEVSQFESESIHSCSQLNRRNMEESW